MERACFVEMNNEGWFKIERGEDNPRSASHVSKILEFDFLDACNSSVLVGTIAVNQPIVHQQSVFLDDDRASIEATLIHIHLSSFPPAHHGESICP